MATRSRRRCDHCGRGAGITTNTLTYRDLSVRLNLCQSDQLKFERDYWTWTKDFGSDACNFCLSATVSYDGEGDHPDDDMIILGDNKRRVMACSGCVLRAHNEITRWTRLGTTVEDTGDLARLAERAEIVRDMKAVEPEKREIPDFTEYKKSQFDSELAEEASKWSWTIHAQERLHERGPIYGFTATDVLLALKKGDREESDASKTARELGLDLGVSEVKYISAKCTVVVKEAPAGAGPDYRPEILTVYEGRENKKPRKA